MRNRSPRGYLMLDVAIGGAIAAVVIATLLTVLADARRQNVAAARDVVASELVLEGIERCRAAGFAGVGGATCPTGAAAAAVTGQTGVYTRQFILQTNNGTETRNGVQINFDDVLVKVSYQTHGSPATRSTQAMTRIYR